MKIIALPDLHESTKRLDTIAGPLAAADIVLLPGDLTNAGGRASAISVLDAVHAHNPALLAVAGNWDHPGVEQVFDEYGINLHRRHVVRDGVVFFGAGGALNAPIPMPNEASEDDFAQFLAEAVAGMDDDDATRDLPRVLVCHQPPKDTRVDKTDADAHIGSTAIRAFIEQQQPLLCVCGHVHEAAAIDSIGATQVINPGPLWKGGYAYIEIIDGQIAALEIRKP